MLEVPTVDQLREALRPARREERTIGLVPTMGALHDGHRALITRARAECDVVVLSLFVNPTQFNDPSDLDRYPRTLGSDLATAESAGADIVFLPPVSEIYPPGSTAQVRLRGPMVESLEGAHRGSGHFHGVSTVVTKLFNIVQPDIAYFGQKDAQQARVIHALVRDLVLPVRIEVVGTVRERDGLAMSSRNAHLAGEDRERALALSAALDAAQAAYDAGEHRAANLIERAVVAMERRGVHPEYFSIVDADTLLPLSVAEDGALVVVAANVGATRLIDNAFLRPAASPAPIPSPPPPPPPIPPQPPPPPPLAKPAKSRSPVLHGRAARQL